MSEVFIEALTEAVRNLVVDNDMIKAELDIYNYDRAFLFITKAIRDMLKAYAPWDRIREECEKLGIAIEDEDEIEKQIAVLRGHRPYLLEVLDSRLEALASGKADKYDLEFMNSSHKKLLDCVLSNAANAERLNELLKSHPWENYRKGTVSSACE